MATNYPYLTPAPQSGSTVGICQSGLQVEVRRLQAATQPPRSLSVGLCTRACRSQQEEGREADEGKAKPGPLASAPGSRPSAAGPGRIPTEQLRPKRRARPYLVVKHRLGVAAFVVALNRQTGELHSVPLQCCGVHGAVAPRRGREGGPDAGRFFADCGGPAAARTRERRGRSGKVYFGRWREESSPSRCRAGAHREAAPLSPDPARSPPGRPTSRPSPRPPAAPRRRSLALTSSLEAGAAEARLAGLRGLWAGPGPRRSRAAGAGQKGLALCT